MKLIDVENGKWVKVTDYSSGRGIEQKLRQLGLLPGDYARVIRQAPFGGPLLVEIQGREIAVGRGVASRILVEEN